MDIIIYETAQGMAVIHPAPDSGMTIEEVAAKDVPAGAAWHIVDKASLPNGRRHRAAWRISGGAVVVDDAARTEIDAANVRAERDAKLATEVDPVVTNPLRWAGLPSDAKARWEQYRADLLNVPQQAGFPDAVVWPQKPE